MTSTGKRGSQWFDTASVAPCPSHNALAAALIGTGSQP